MRVQFSIEVFGVGYNGAKKDALHRDFVQGDDDKGKWALHAEQNVFMFRCIDDASACELYSTHSPCVQCSGIVRSMGIEKVVYSKHYRLPVDLEHDRRAVCMADAQLLQFVKDIQPSGTTPAARPPPEGPPAKQGSPGSLTPLLQRGSGPQGEKPPPPNLQGQ